MADNPISNLPEKTTLADADLVPIVDSVGTVTKKITRLNFFNTIKSFLESLTNTNFLTDTEQTAIGVNTNKVSADGSVTTHSDVTDAGRGSIITTEEGDKLSRIDTPTYVSAGRSASDTDKNKLIILADAVTYTFGSNTPADFRANFRCVNITGNEVATINFNAAILGEDGQTISAITLDAGAWLNVSRVTESGLLQGRLILSE